MIWSTALTTFAAVVISFIASLFVSVFMVEFAPAPVQRVLEPVIRLLASVPSVIYGLIGVLVVVPFIADNLITNQMQQSVYPVIPLSGESLLAGVVLLTLMISPVMISTFTEGLRAVPKGWLEGSIALGGETAGAPSGMVAVLTARPSLIAGTVLGDSPRPR